MIAAPESRIIREIEDHHAVLERWLGTVADPALLTEFIGAHTADFSLVTTDGHIVSGDELADSLRGAGNAAPGLRVVITAVEVQLVTAEVAIARFHETHHTETGGGSGVRIVTAVLVPAPGARNGLRWRSVHETLRTD
ncbi:DUF4440 domain-containing protein [Rhodococcus maanshanensis]|uniref:Uncharacterized protein n=1 Tax=Rhodococcus maanshanensis TaxID=183556 RepID=A0A1H7U3M6_9NOCA|nr:DUF4440 domain-containing protein [Rhodococcus maanshanensis]SEL91276.1 hypothetical protein SAMN05444583_11736 [Rhodococcus maanshanensis]